MYDELQSQKDNLSHAYVLSGSIKSSKTDLERFMVNDLGIQIVGNSNYFDRSFDRLGINEVRDLGQLQSKTAVGDGNKIFVTSFNTITVEAQNAMLKMFEEPTPGTIWFLLVPDHHLLLPTILSRAQLISSDTEGSYQELATEFLSASYQNREKIFTEFLGDSKKNIAPNRIGAAGFIGELMSQVLSKKPNGFIDSYRELEQMRDFVTDRSSSVKYIMEYIAIRL